MTRVQTISELESQFATLTGWEELGQKSKFSHSTAKASVVVMFFHIYNWWYFT